MFEKIKDKVTIDTENLSSKAYVNGHIEVKDLLEARDKFFTLFP
jgi:hypothetical protein